MASSTLAYWTASGPFFDPESLRLSLDRIRDSVELGLLVFQDEVRQRTPVNLGFLRNSIIPLVRDTPTGFYGDLVSTFLYAIPIDLGRTPGAPGPPYAPILEWAEQVGPSLGIPNEQFPTIEGWAWVVRRNIHERGFSPAGKVGRDGARMFEEGFAAASENVEILLIAAAESMGMRLQTYH